MPCVPPRPRILQACSSPPDTDTGTHTHTPPTSFRFFTHLPQPFPSIPPKDVASFYQGLSWATYTAGALLSAYTTGRLLDAAGPRPVFGLAAAGLLLDGACAALLQEQRVGVQRVVGAGVGSRGRGDGGGGGKAWWRRWWPWERRGEEQEEEAGYGKRMAGGAGGGGGRVRPGVDVRATVSLVRAREAAAGADQGGTGEGEAEAEAEPLLLPLLGAEEASEEGLVGEAVKVLITPAGGGGGCGGAAGVLPLLRAVWVTLRDPHIAMPALFIFLWQVKSGGAGTGGV